jgi:hypothetical protein
MLIHGYTVPVQLKHRSCLMSSQRLHGHYSFTPTWLQFLHLTWTQFLQQRQHGHNSHSKISCYTLQSRLLTDKQPTYTFMITNFAVKYPINLTPERNPCNQCSQHPDGHNSYNTFKLTLTQFFHSRQLSNTFNVTILAVIQYQLMGFFPKKGKFGDLFGPWWIRGFLGEYWKSVIMEHFQ